MANTGHGHVYPRLDGVKARCGGPGMCAECAADFFKLFGTRYAQVADRAHTPPHGCICPPSAEKTCQGWNCPRRSASGMFQQAEQYAQGIAAQRGETPPGGSTAKPQEPDPSTARDAPKAYQREPTKLEQVARALEDECLRAFGSKWSIPQAQCFARAALEALAFQSTETPAILAHTAGRLIRWGEFNAILDSILTEKQGE